MKQPISDWFGTDFHFKESPDGLVEVNQQVLTDGFLRGLRDVKKYEERSRYVRRKEELRRVASVPAIIVEKWLKEGFNVYREPARAVVKKCCEEGLDDFVTTRGRV